MQQHTGRVQDDEASSSGSSPFPGQATRAPLVIVSERGRHTDESRRIVRAQAARASAAQSRVTRARNREEREGAIRDGPASPGTGPSRESPSDENEGKANVDPVQRPLVMWLSGISNLSFAQLADRAQRRASSPLSGISTPLTPSSGGSSNFGSLLSAGQVPRELRPHLPRAVPIGVLALRHSPIQMSDDLVDLLSRTSCFDFDSPGVAERLHQLLFDLIIGYAGSGLFVAQLPGDPLQDHLRIACVCLTLFLGTRLDSAVTGYDNMYQRGLEAAWSEIVSLDQNMLYTHDHQAKKASLWAAFMISVTTGAIAEAFDQLLRRILEDLELLQWSKVRSVLLEFIYPVSFLDEPCRMFYERLKRP